MTDTTPADADRFEIAAPHRDLLDQVLDRWSLAVLNELCDAPARFSTLRRAIPAVTQKSLTATLRRLERNGIVERVVLSTRPVAVEYRITALGKTLRPPVDVILAWAQEHMPRIEDARRRFDEAMDATLGFGSGVAQTAPAGTSSRNG
ncbi:winged helix-turn-helix transcriptional regulator [Microbacterium sp. NPDC006705]|uniref:winged helix-turn-helix transcriptional regulator n=1 Tax=Microbacterium sp. NPDC006705 TaxID=3364181 RepID=UPI00384BF4D3